MPRLDEMNEVQRNRILMRPVPVGIIRFFEAFAQNYDADMRERPAGMSKADFMRYCSDDLKAMSVIQNPM